MVAEVHELVVEMRRHGGHVVGGAGEEDGRDFTGGAADGENAAGHDAGQRLGQDDLDDGFELRGAEGEAGFAESRRNGSQRFLGGDDDHGQGHDRESE